MNDITQKPEPEEEVILVERKETFTGLMGLSYKDNVLARGTSNENGIVNFGVWDLKKRNKFSYLVILQYKSSYTFYQHVVDELEVDLNNSNNTLKLSFGPTINSFYAKPTNIINQSQGDIFSINAVSKYAIENGLSGGDKNYYRSPQNISDFSKLWLYDKNKMGTYFITLIKQKNGIKDTLKDTVFCPRDQDYIYEFEF
jgi:hypothetical protein